MFHKTAAGILAGAIVLSAFTGDAAFAQTKTLESIIAWVNSDIILKSEYDKRLKEVRDELSRAKLQGAQLEKAFADQSKGALEQMINETLLLQQAKDMGLTADIEVLKALEKMRQDNKLESQEALEKEIVSQGYTLDEVKQNIRVKVLSDRVLQREVYPKVVITNDEVRKYYDAHTKDFDRPAGIRLREITVITENRGPEEIASQRKKLEDALAALKKGDDFAAVAAKYSESKTANDGGDLGFIAKNELTPSLEAVVGKLDKGQLTDIVDVQGALMIFKLDDRHNGGILPFELAQREITNILYDQGIPPKVRDFLTKLRADGFVRVADGYVDTGAPQKTESVSEVK